MYSEQRILERLYHSKKVLGWLPERHSIEEVVKFQDRLRRIEFTDPKTPTIMRVDDTLITPQEARWMKNEIHMCACDADYFLTRYVYIRDETNTIRQFQWRAPQRVALRIIADMEARGFSIEIQWLKGRQLGVSTIIEFLIAHRILFGYGINGVVASCDTDKSEKMAGMIWLLVNRCPWWLKPTERQNKIHKLLSFENECSIEVQAGNQTSGIARGGTTTSVHLSELADYPNPEELVDASLFHAVHPSPKVFLHLESTGNNNIGWWADTWRYNKAHWHEGKSRLRPVFLPWFMGSDIYPMPTWLKQRPIPSDWRPLPETTAHADKCTAYARNTDVLIKELGSNWSLPREQAWYWEVNYLEHKSKRIEKQWFQEMPADDYEALQSRQERVFQYEVITEIESRRKKEYDIYAVTGEGIEDKFSPLSSEIDYSRPRERVEFTAKSKTFRWELVPLDVPQIEDTDTNLWNAKLLVWEPPEAGYQYSVAIDTAGGGGLDRTVISVTRLGRIKSEPETQAAELASDKISSAEAYAFAIAIATWYAITDLPLTAAEQVRKPGDIVQLQMKQMGWPVSRMHHMVRYDGKKVIKAKATKLGWYTTSITRPLLISMFIAAVENGWYRINSKFLKEECESMEAYETDSGLVKMDHASGKHNDRFFAAAISYFIVNDLKLMIERSKIRFLPTPERLPQLVLDKVEMNRVPFRVIWGDRYPGQKYT